VSYVSFITYEILFFKDVTSCAVIPA